VHMMIYQWYTKLTHNYELELLGKYHEVLLKNGILEYSLIDVLRDYKVSVKTAINLPISQWESELMEFVWTNNLENILVLNENLDSIELS
jgi:hypothetical protein